MEQAEKEQRTRDALACILGSVDAVSQELSAHDIGQLAEHGYDTERKLRAANADSLQEAGLNKATAMMLAKAAGTSTGTGTTTTTSGIPSAGMASGSAAVADLKSIARNLSSIAEDVEEVKDDMVLIKYNLPFARAWVESMFKPPSKASRGSNQSFRRALMKYYDNRAFDGLLTCMVLGERMEQEFVVAGHLFADQHKDLSNALMGFNVADPRNGLLWASCIEDAYELQQLCFSYLGGDTFMLHVLDRGLLSTQLCDKGKHKNDPSFKAAMKHKVENRDRTFADVDGKECCFACTSGAGPYRRALAFQASRALKNMANKFPSTFHPEHYNFDYVSDFDDRTAFVASWLSNLDIAQPSELAPSSSNAASAPPSSKGDSVQ